MNIFFVEWRIVTPVKVMPYGGGDFPEGDRFVNDIQEGNAFITASSKEAVEYAVKQLYPTATVKVKWDKVEEWSRKHKQVYTGAIGGRYTYSFTPTGLGTIVKIHDPITDETLDVTDYESW